MNSMSEFRRPPAASVDLFLQRSTRHVLRAGPPDPHMTEEPGEVLPMFPVCFDTDVPNCTDGTCLSSSYHRRSDGTSPGHRVPKHPEVAPPSVHKKGSWS